MMIKISIIIPVYNSALFIRECINSVIMQTLKDIEIICIDDGSTDDSLNIIQEMQNDDCRIIVLKQAHSFAAAARNYGLKVAKGDYIAFLDADDFFVDTFALERLYTNSIKYHANICAADIIYLDMAYGYTAPFKNCIINYINKAHDVYWINFFDIQDDYLFTRYIYKRQLLMDNNILFPLYVKYEDPPFLLTVMCLENRFLYIPITLYCYRIHYKSGTLNKKQLVDTLRGIQYNMKLSYKNNFISLYDKLISRLFNDYRNYIIENWSPEIYNSIEEIIEFHSKTHSGENLLLRFLRLLGESNDSFRYIFPYHLFNKNDRIIILGTHSLCKSFVFQLRTMPYFLEVLAAIDYTEVKPMELISILNDVEFDYILIATKNLNQFRAIKKTLNEFGIEDKSIKWDGVNYIKEHFFQNILYNIATT